MDEESLKLFKLENMNVDMNLTHLEIHDEVEIHVFLNRTGYACPICGSYSTIGHGIRLINMVHSISTCEKCKLVLHSRRLICKDCKSTFMEFNPFALENDRISKLTLSLILDDLKDQSVTFTSVAKKYHISVTTLIKKFDKYVNCARLPLPNIICMDEIYAKRLTKRKYCFVMIDFNTNKLIDITPSRHKTDLINYFSRIPEKEARKVEIVIMDMWEPYRDVAKFALFDPIIAIDSFHVIKHLNEAMDKIRLLIMKKFDKEHSSLENAHTYYYFLKKFHYFFKKRYDSIYDGNINVGKLGKWKKDEIRKYILSIDDDLTEAYQLKERYQEFNLTARYENCDEELDKFINEFKHSKYDEFKEFGRLLKHWRKEIKNSFMIVDGRRLSNGAMEGVNSRLKCIVKNANGYKNFNRFRNRSFYCINKNIPLKVYPKK